MSNIKVDKEGRVTITNAMGKVCEVGVIENNTAANRGRIVQLADDRYRGRILNWQQAKDLLMQVNGIQDTCTKRELIRQFGLPEPPAAIPENRIRIEQNGNTISVTILEKVTE